MGERHEILCSILLLIGIGIPFILCTEPVRGDEFEYAKMAHVLITGQEITFWHLRNFFYPFLLSIMYLPFRSVLRPSLSIFIIISRVFNLLLLVGSTFLIYLITKRSSEEAAGFASLCFSVNWLVIYWGTRSTTQAPAVFFTLLGIHLLLKNDIKLNYLAGLSMSMAFAAWFGTIALLVPTIFFAETNKKRGVLLFGFITGCMIFLGILDWIMYGKAFESAWRFFRFNILHGKNAQWNEYWGAKPWYFYFTIAPVYTLGPLLLGVAVTFKNFVLEFTRKKIATLMCTMIFSFIVIFSLITHKEYRFFYIALPAFIISASIGFEHMKTLNLRTQLKVVYLIVLAFNLAVLLTVTISNQVIV